MPVNEDIYEEYEDAITARLQPLTQAQINVRTAPQTTSDWKTPFKKGLVTVSYLASDFKKDDPAPENQMSIGVVAQKEIMHFNISCEARKRRGAIGVLRLVKYVTALLVGFKPLGSGRMYMIEQLFEDYNPDLQTWAYNLVIASEAVLVQAPEEDVDEETLLQQITLSNNLDDETTIPVDHES